MADKVSSLPVDGHAISFDEQGVLEIELAAWPFDNFQAGSQLWIGLVNRVGEQGGN
jgi:hypothetical protein